MYIHRSVLLLFAIIFLILSVGIDWLKTADAAWYRPFIIALGIILLSAWIQRHQEHDDY